MVFLAGCCVALVLALSALLCFLGAADIGLDGAEDFRDDKSSAALSFVLALSIAATGVLPACAAVECAADPLGCVEASGSEE